MQVSEAMSRDVKLARPDQSIMEAAKLMAECDCGSVPVQENDRLVGMITDRDIVVRAIAQGKDGSTMVKDVMSEQIKYCFEEDNLEDVAQNMGDLQIRRLPVVNKDKRLVGIISLGDIANVQETETVGEALCSISEPASEHQTMGIRPH
jgi:CBS domain-containing protein